MGRNDPGLHKPCDPCLYASLPPIRKGVDEMLEELIQLKNSEAAGYVVPLGPVNLVWGVARRGMVGCGAFDVRALEKFGYPAARVRPVGSPSIATLEDLLSGEISETNSGAAAMGIQVGMSGKEALDRLS